MNPGKKISPIKQPEDDACGPVAIEIALNYLGISKSFEEIVQISEYDKEEGMSNAQLKKAFDEMGIKNQVTVPASWEILTQQNSTDSLVIVSWMLNGYIGHFSVVDHVTDTHIYLNNPETGEIDEMEKIIFMRLWFDYDDMWYPENNTEIQLRWMLSVSK